MWENSFIHPKLYLTTYSVASRVSSVRMFLATSNKQNYNQNNNNNNMTQGDLKYKEFIISYDKNTRG